MLSQQDFKDRIIKYVDQNPGGSAIELTLAAVKNEAEYSLDIPPMLEDWIKDGTLIMIECDLGNQTIERFVLG